MRNCDKLNGQTGETAWCMTLVSAMLVLVSALGILASIWGLLLLLGQPGGVFSFMGSGLLLLVGLANVTVVLLLTFSWLSSSLRRRSLSPS
jgi:hypothetical protein